MNNATTCTKKETVNKAPAKNLLVLSSPSERSSARSASRPKTFTSNHILISCKCHIKRQTKTVTKIIKKLPCIVPLSNMAACNRLKRLIMIYFLPLQNKRHYCLCDLTSTLAYIGWIWIQNPYILQQDRLIWINNFTTNTNRKYL